jgi:hypothetical protein
MSGCFYVRAILYGKGFYLSVFSREIRPPVMPTSMDAQESGTAAWQQALSTAPVLGPLEGISPLSLDPLPTADMADPFNFLTPTEATVVMSQTPGEWSDFDWTPLLSTPLPFVIPHTWRCLGLTHLNTRLSSDLPNDTSAYYYAADAAWYMPRFSGCS